MFRRREDEGTSKEDTLFGTTESANAAESATVVTSSQPASTSAAGYNSGNAAHVTNQPASRAATPQAANAFRPNSTAPIGGDLARNRMPEAKTSAAAVTLPGAASLAASSADKNKSARRVLTVGNDILLKGEIATCDRLVIEGKVDATLNDVHTVEIAESGSFKGSAQIEDAEISGLFEGDLVVRNRLVIYATGKVRGKITYGEIEIERGGELTGEIKTISQAGTATRPSRIAGKEQKFEAA